MLDLTHVIAGPVAARLLAQFGADVLHLSRPDPPRPDPDDRDDRVAQAQCLLRPARRSRPCGLPGRAPGRDVFVHAYRGLARHGAQTEELVRRRPGLITLEYHAWGAEGPWGERGGFDQLACSATGFAIEEWTRPAVAAADVPAQRLPRLAYLGAAAVANGPAPACDRGRLAGGSA
ncbi:CoA transferase [Streptomyces thioluteus]|uniref:CoA transferase n=1 Tax=Streptomyces thioluteus TaxID=66431 RepID=UPI0031EA3460